MRKAAWLGPAVVTAALLIATTIALRLEGRVWWCEQGDWLPWATDVWSPHCSQHLLDPYSLSHVCHGLIFAGALAWLCRSRRKSGSGRACRVPVRWQFVIAIATAAAWEIAENSAWVINRYRTATMSLDYLGDSVANSLSDVACCGVGFWIARRIGWKWSIALFIALELISLACIRDNLTLNVIMLIHPVQAIKQWQTAGHTP